MESTSYRKVQQQNFLLSFEPLIQPHEWLVPSIEQYFPTKTLGKYSYLQENKWTRDELENMR
jgi:hypothetical protein